MAGADQVPMVPSSGTSVLSVSSSQSTGKEDRSRSERPSRLHVSAPMPSAAPYGSTPYFTGSVSGASGSADASEQVATEPGSSSSRARRLQGRAEDEVSLCSGVSETPSMAMLSEDEREVRRIERYQKKLAALLSARLQKAASKAGSGSEPPGTDASSVGE